MLKNDHNNHNSSYIGFDEMEQVSAVDVITANAGAEMGMPDYSLAVVELVALRAPTALVDALSAIDPAGKDYFEQQVLLDVAEMDTHVELVDTTAAVTIHMEEQVYSVMNRQMPAQDMVALELAALPAPGLLHITQEVADDSC
uniref:Uncharacterized protein n=1 Tax=Leptocylindrus danicus TaxID=163516 RepID=A0A7S2L542_9STRA|mmetsp:Transcript_31485/g.45873  ORF Transcript_31485/g.45873 Transcript_31485/m.45873 type:complete len:143 (+) Transcript_31485:509-937(+)